MKEWFLLTLILVMIFLSGCTDQNSAPGVDNVLRIYLYRVDTTEVKTGEKVDIDFNVENQGEKDVKAKIGVVDPKGFEVEKLECNRKNSCNEVTIHGYDAADVSIALKAPSSEQTTDIDFFVEYGYSGHSTFSFSIWNSSVPINEQWGEKENPNTPGPIKVNMDGKFKTEVIIDEQQKTIDQWIREGDSFTLTMDVKNVGSLGAGYSFPEITILKGDFKVKFNYVNPKLEECDLEKKDDYYIPKEDVIVPTKSPLTCKLTSVDIEERFVRGSVDVDYSYDYRFLRKQNLRVV